MPYTSTDDFLAEMSYEELARLTGDETGTTVDTARLEKAQNDADSLINALLFGKVEVPFAEVPPLISQIAVTFTLANLFDYACIDSYVPNTIITRKLDAINTLKKIENGYVALENTFAAGIINKCATKHYFTDSLLNEFTDYRQ